MAKKQKLVMDDPWGKTPIVYIEKVYYEKPRNMGLRLYCEDGPYCTLTINTGKKCEEGYAFVDSTYGPFNEWFVEGFEERNKANKRRAERKEARYWDRKTEVIYG